MAQVEARMHLQAAPSVCNPCCADAQAELAQELFPALGMLPSPLTPASFTACVREAFRSQANNAAGNQQKALDDVGMQG